LTFLKKYHRSHYNTCICQPAIAAEAQIDSAIASYAVLVIDEIEMHFLTTLQHHNVSRAKKN